MSDALKQSSDLNRLKKRVSEFVTAVRQSSTLREEFQACQQHLGSKKKVLIKDVETRWNSTVLMIKRFADLKESLVLFQLSEEGSTFKITEEDFTLAEQVVHLLEPMYSATVELSVEKYVSGSKVIPMTKILMRFYAKEAGQHPRVTFKQSFTEVMLNSFTSRLDNVEFVNPWL